MADPNPYQILKRMTEVVDAPSPVLDAADEFKLRQIKAAELAARGAGLNRDPKEEQRQATQWGQLVDALPVGMRTSYATETLRSSPGWGARIPSHYGFSIFEHAVADTIIRNVESEPDAVKRVAAREALMAGDCLYLNTREKRQQLRQGMLQDIDKLPSPEQRSEAAILLARWSHDRNGNSPHQAEFEPAVQKALSQLEEVTDPKARVRGVLTLSRLTHPSTNVDLDRQVVGAWAKHVSRIPNAEERIYEANFAIQTGGFTLQRLQAPMTWAENLIDQPDAAKRIEAVQTRAADPTNRNSWEERLKLDGLNALQSTPQPKVGVSASISEAKPKIDYKAYKAKLDASRASKPPSP